MIIFSKNKQMKAEELEYQDSISLNQFVASAVTEQLSALLTVFYLNQRAERNSQDAFEAVLTEIPDVEPEMPDN
jgi:hypothetical protein